MFGPSMKIVLEGREGGVGAGGGGGGGEISARVTCEGLEKKLINRGAVV